METYTIDRDEIAAAVRSALAGLDLRALVMAETERVARIERERNRQEQERHGRDRDEAARLAKVAILREAARLGPIQLRYMSDAAPEALRWVPALPPGAVRR